MSLRGQDSQRLGFFVLPWLTRDGEEELVAEMMSGSFVTKCDYEYYHQAFRYYLLHPSFKMVSNGTEAPQYYVAWQGSRMVLVPERPEVISFKCPSKKQAESWLKTMQKMQREWPTRQFLPEYP